MVDTNDQKDLQSYSSDKPLDDPKDDFLGRHPFAKRIADMILNRTDPHSIVIGINGEWGSGKTTVLNFIHHELSQAQNTVCIRFNPWRFPEEDKLLRDFFDLLAKAVDGSITNPHERIGNWMKKKVTFNIPTPWGEFPLKSMADLLSSTDLEEIKKRVEKRLVEKGKQVVVLIDDIDRLQRDEIQAVFRIIKLTGDFNHTVYVLAFDENMVASAMNEQFDSGDTKAGERFIEKIVQIPLDLPAIPQSKLRNFALRRIFHAVSDEQIKFSEQDNQRFLDAYYQSLEPRIKTPRLGHLYGNKLAFALPLLIDEVNLADHMLLIGMQLLYKDVYNFVRENPQYLLREMTFTRRLDSPEDRQKQAKDAIDQLLDEYPDAVANDVRKLLTFLFPWVGTMYQGIFAAYQEDDNQMKREKRICIWDYFHRYFSVQIIEEEISDRLLASFLGSLHTAPDAQAIMYEFQKIVEQNPGQFIEKISAHADTLPRDDVIKLVDLFAENGPCFPYEEQFFQGGVFSRASLLTADLIFRIRQHDVKFAIATKTVQEANPLPYAADIFRWLRRESNLYSEPFTKEELQHLGSLFVERIQKDAKQEKSLMELYPEHAMGLFKVWRWYGGKEQVEQYLKEWIQKDPRVVDTLLLAVLPYSLGFDGKRTKWKLFEQDEYASISHLLDPEIIYQALKKRYGKELESDDYPTDQTLSPEQKAAMEFAWLHRKTKSQDQENN